MDNNWCMIQLTTGVIGQIEFNVVKDPFVMNMMEIAKILTQQPQKHLHQLLNLQPLCLILTYQVS